MLHCNRIDVTFEHSALLYRATDLSFWNSRAVDQYVFFLGNAALLILAEFFGCLLVGE